jgi:hypothetical protein
MDATWAKSVNTRTRRSRSRRRQGISDDGVFLRNSATRETSL